MAEAVPLILRRTCACCQKKANDGGIDGEPVPLHQTLCGGCRGKKCLGRCGRTLEAGDVLNTCQACAASVADATPRDSGRGLLRCLIAQANGNKDEKFQIKGMRAAFIASINGFDPARNADSLALEELVLYRAAMAWLHLKDKASYNHIRKQRRTRQGFTQHKSKTTVLGRVRGDDIHRGYGPVRPLLQTQYRCFDGDEPDAEAAEAAGDAVAEEYDALRDGTSPTSTAVEDARRLGAVRRCEQAAAGALRSKYPQTRRRAEDVARGVAAAQRVTLTSAEERDIRDQSRTPAEREASEAQSQYNAAYAKNPDSVRNAVHDGSSTLDQDNSKKKTELKRKSLLRRRSRGEVREGDRVLVGRSREESGELRRESLARKKAGEGTWVRCTRCTSQSKWRSILERPRCVLCDSTDFIVPAPAPEASSSSEEEEEVVVEVEPGGIYRGTKLRQQGPCALVKLECGDEGSLNAMNCEGRQLPALDATFYVRVLRIENKGRKIVLSTKNINQETGKPTIAPDSAGEPVCQGKLDESAWGRSTEPASANKSKGGRLYLAEALGDGFTDVELARVFVVNKTKPRTPHDLICATRDGTRLKGINAIRKYLEDQQRDTCKAKRRRVESDAPAEGSDADDEEEAPAPLG